MKRYHLVKVVFEHHATKESIIYSSDSLEPMYSVISFYKGLLKEGERLEIRELLDDDMKLIKIV